MDVVEALLPGVGRRYEFTLDDTMDEMIRRVRELDLRATGDEQELLNDFAMMLAVDATHALYSKKHWVPL